MFRYQDLITGAVTQAALDAASRAHAIAFVVNWFRELLNVTLVSFIGTYALLMGLIGYLIPRAVLKRRRKDAVVPIPPFSEYALPDRFWLAFFLSYLFAVIGDSFGWPGFDILEVTVYAPVFAGWTVRGLAFLAIYISGQHEQSARVALHVADAGHKLAGAAAGSVVDGWALGNIAKMRKSMKSKA